MERDLRRRSESNVTSFFRAQLANVPPPPGGGDPGTMPDIARDVQRSLIGQRWSADRQRLNATAHATAEPFAAGKRAACWSAGRAHQSDVGTLSRGHCPDLLRVDLASDNLMPAAGHDLGKELEPLTRKIRPQQTGLSRLVVSAVYRLRRLCSNAMERRAG